MLVATTDATAGVAGFVAGVGDLGALYRSFLLRDGVVAGALAAPRLVRAVPRVRRDAPVPRRPPVTCPTAEILAVAVGTDRSGAGIGRRWSAPRTAEFRRRGDHGREGGHDRRQRAPPSRCTGPAGSGRPPAIEVHAGRASEVLVWTAS